MEVGKIQISPNGEIHALYHNLAQLYYELRSIYKDLDNNSSKLSFFSFHVLASSTIELSLNFINLYQTFTIYGKELYKPIYQSYNRLSFADKIKLYPSIFSLGKFKSNTSNEAIQTLLLFISKRNNLMHPKPEIVEIDLSIPQNFQNNFLEYIKHSSENKMGIQLNWEVEGLQYSNLTFADCEILAKSLGKFRELYVEPMTSDIRETDLIVAV